MWPWAVMGCGSCAATGALGVVRVLIRDGRPGRVSDTVHKAGRKLLGPLRG